MKIVKVKYLVVKNKGMKKGLVFLVILITITNGCNSIITDLGGTQTFTDDKNIQESRDIVGFYNQNPEEVTIFMERHPCYGTCPTYYFVIFGDGKSYLWDTRSNIVEIGQVNKEDILSLLNKYEEINYLELKDRYTSSITDASAVSTGITLGSESKHIYNYMGLGPDELKELEQDFDSVKDKTTFEEINLTKEICDKMYSKTYYFLGKEWNTVQKDYCYYDVGN